MRPVKVPRRVKRVEEHPFWRSFHHAFEGIVYAARSERNMRIHLVAAAAVLFATLYLRLDRAYVALICLTVALVLAMELLNTAIEAVTDLMTVAHAPHHLDRGGRGGRRHRTSSRSRRLLVPRGGIEP